MTPRKFDANMTVREALDSHPSARWVFAAWHIGGCRECPASPTETLEEVAIGYQLPLDRFLADLNSLLDGERVSGPQ